MDGFDRNVYSVALLRKLSRHSLTCTTTHWRTHHTQERRIPRPLLSQVCAEEREALRQEKRHLEEDVRSHGAALRDGVATLRADRPPQPAREYETR